MNGKFQTPFYSRTKVVRKSMCWTGINYIRDNNPDPSFFVDHHNICMGAIKDILPDTSCLPKAPIKNRHLATSLLPPHLVCDYIPELEPDLKRVRRSSRFANHDQNEEEEEEEMKIEKPEDDG